MYPGKCFARSSLQILAVCRVLCAMCCVPWEMLDCRYLPNLTFYVWVGLALDCRVEINNSLAEILDQFNYLLSISKDDLYWSRGEARRCCFDVASHYFSTTVSRVSLLWAGSIQSHYFSANNFKVVLFKTTVSRVSLLFNFCECVWSISDKPKVVIKIGTDFWISLIIC